MTSPGRLRLLALRDQCEAVGETMAIERYRFDALREAEAPRAVSAFNLFQTPEPIAARMVSACGPLDGKRILEPSAGLGRLYRAIRARSDAHVTLIELAPQCAAELYRETRHDEQARLIQDDFLVCSAERLGTFDLIVMNPPFSNGIDIKFYLHAMAFVAESGIIVGLCYDGKKQNRQLRELADTWEVLPKNSFRSEGTNASVALLTIRKQQCQGKQST